MASYSNVNSANNLNLQEQHNPNAQNPNRKDSKDLSRKKYTVLRKWKQKVRCVSLPGGVKASAPENRHSHEDLQLEDLNSFSVDTISTMSLQSKDNSFKDEHLQSELYSTERPSTSQSQTLPIPNIDQTDSFTYSMVSNEVNEQFDVENQPDSLSTHGLEAAEVPCVFVEMNKLFERPILPSKTQCMLKCCCDTKSPDQDIEPNLEDPDQTKTEGRKVATGKTSLEQESKGDASDSSVYQYFDMCYPTVIQDSIREMAQEARFTDVIIDVGGHSFRCHRIILAASSNYFRAMFCASYREKDQPSVSIKGVTAEVMKILIRYAYTSYLEITEENAQTVLEAASLLQFTRVMEACANYFATELSIENAPGFMELAQRHNLRHLFVIATLKCVTHFGELITRSDYLIVSAQILESIVSRDDLNIAVEEEVYEVVISWCQHDPATRKKELPRLLQHVKLPLILPNYFIRNVETNELIRCNEELHDMMMEARKYHLMGGITEGAKIMPRKNTTMHQVFVTVGGCDNNDRFTGEVCVLDFQHKTRASLCQLPNSKNSIRGITATATGVSADDVRAKWAEFACTSWKNNLVITGGKETKKETWMFLTSLRQWVELASLNTGRWRHRMVVCLGEMYVVGGYDGLLRVDCVERYDERENRWVERRNLREAVSSAAVCECKGRIYVIGGGPSVRISTEKVQVYDPITNDWRLSTPMLEPAKCINSVALRSNIYVVGGTLKHILQFDTTTETWSKVGEELSHARASCGVTLCNDKVFIVGGRDDAGKAQAGVTYLDPDTLKLRLECNMPAAISHHGCVTLQKHDQLRSRIF